MPRSVAKIARTRAVFTRAATLVVFLLTPLAAAQEEPRTAQPPAKSEAAGAHAEKGAAHAAAPVGAAHAEHDETDVGHGNATAALASPTDFRFDLSLFSFVVFLLLLAVLYKFAWGPIATALGQREETIQRQIDEARLASEKAAHQLREYEARLSAATDEARQIVAQARKDAEVAKDKIVAEARDAAGKERERAVAEITTAKNQALDEIAQRSVQTAISLASKVIRREVKPQEHEALIGEAINEFSKLN